MYTQAKHVCRIVYKIQFTTAEVEVSGTRLRPGAHTVVLQKVSHAECF
jgi:hypothetical protein